MNTYEKIKYLCEKNGFAISYIGDKIPDLTVNKSALSGWKKGSVPRPDKIKLIADYFGVSVDYLLDRPTIEDEVELNDSTTVPIVGRVVAGKPIESPENYEGYIVISYKPKEDYFALRVHGNSMIEAGIPDKSVLVVHKQQVADSGDIIVALINGEQTVKRFKRYDSGKVFLVPANPDFEPIPVTDSDDLLILGKVVEIRITL